MLKIIYDRDPIFKHIGTNVSECLTWEEVIKKADLDWRVDKIQLEREGKPQPAWANYRINPKDEDIFLGQVGADYNPIQNKDMFIFVNNLIESMSGSYYEIAGHLNDSKHIWCLARLPNKIKIKDSDDLLFCYLLFHNRHDGYNSAIAKLTIVRSIFANTLNLNLKNETSLIKLYHYENAEKNLQDVNKTIAIINSCVKDFNHILNALAAHKLIKAEIQGILYNIFKNLQGSSAQKNKARRILEIYENNDNDAFPSQRGTAYNLLNAFTNYIDYESTVRKIPNETEFQARARNAMFGLGGTFKSQVLQIIVEEIGISENPHLIS